MNNISKTIQWADLSWNPIKGLCPVGCWYCYARKMYKRFGWEEGLSFDSSGLDKYGRIKSGSKIFVCSTMDLFHPDIPASWRSIIFKRIQVRSDLIFIILTKLPQNIDRPMPPNVWLGVSMTGPADTLRWIELQKHPASVRFVSAEPLLEPYSIKAPFPDWLILGRLTGHGKKYDPSRNELLYIHDDCQREKVPLFMKSNLAGIWPFKLTKEWPKC